MSHAAAVDAAGPAGPRTGTAADRARSRRIGAGGGAARTGLLGSGWRRGLGLAVALVVLAVAAMASLAFGARSVPLSDVLPALVDPDGSSAHRVVREMRLDRTVVGILVGAALGLAGALMQGVTRNPLAEPGILGVSGGASFAVVVALRFTAVDGPGALVPYALAGAVVASLAVYAVGSAGRAGATPVRLALAGAAMSALFTSATSAVLLLDAATLDRFRFWVVGSLLRDPGDSAYGVVPALAIGVALALALPRSLDGLALGDDAARALGIRVGATRLVATVAVACLTGAAVAAAGPIAFVGLVVPHLARAITGPDHRWVLPWSMVIGPILLLAADVIGRLVVRPEELQVGLVTALLGAPALIAIVRRRHLVTT